MLELQGVSVVTPDGGNLLIQGLDVQVRQGGSWVARRSMGVWVAGSLLIQGLDVQVRGRGGLRT